MIPHRLKSEVITFGTFAKFFFCFKTEKISTLFSPLLHFFNIRFEIKHSNKQGQLLIRYLAQGYFNVQTEGAREQPSDPPNGRRPTLPPEPQPPQSQLSVL